MKFWDLIDSVNVWQKGDRIERFKGKIVCSELDDFCQEKGSKGIIVWGAGKDGRKAIKVLEILGKKEVFWCDKRKAGQVINNMPVVSVDDIWKKAKECIFIIATRDFGTEVMEEIVGYDASLKERIFLYQELLFQKIHKEESWKKAVLSYPPLWLTLGVTSACSNKCLFCSYHGDEAKGISKTYGLPFMLSLQDFIRMVDMAKEARVPRIHICGTGEPFYNPDILKMADYVIEQYGSVSLQTEFGKKLFEKKGYLDELIKRETRITSISTDVLSGVPKEHERIKKGASYSDFMDAMEYIGKRSSLLISANVILTRSNYKNIKKIVDDFVVRNVNARIVIVNLLSYDYSEYTSSENVYRVGDVEIEKELNEVKLYAEQNGIPFIMGKAAGSRENNCFVFWDTFQTWPVAECDPARYGENMIPHACAAVVRGELNSLGYLFDYDTIMDAWNNDILVGLRENMLKGIYPSEWCKRCFHYTQEDSYYFKE